MGNVLEALAAEDQRIGGFFTELITDAIAPLLEVVKEMICLVSVQERLTSGSYDTITRDQFRRAIERMCLNALNTTSMTTVWNTSYRYHQHVQKVLERRSLRHKIVACPAQGYFMQQKIRIWATSCYGRLRR